MLLWGMQVKVPTSVDPKGRLWSSRFSLLLWCPFSLPSLPVSLRLLAIGHIMVLADAALSLILFLPTLTMSFFVFALIVIVFYNSMFPTAMDLQETPEFSSLTPTSFSDLRAISFFSSSQQLD